MSEPASPAHAPTIRTFEERDRAAVVDLWEACDLVRPWNDPHRDIDRKVATQPDLFLVAERGGVLAGTVMAGYDGHRGWMNYLAVSPHLQGAGLGRALVAAAEDRLLGLGCPKLNLQIRATNAAVVAFYESQGYAVDEVVSMGKRLIEG